MMPPAPARFSTTKVWPIEWVNVSAVRRARMSVAEPGVKATMILTGREGYCASAAVQSARAAAASARRRIGDMGEVPPAPDSRSDVVHEHQHDHDDQHEPEAAAGPVAPSAAVGPRGDGAHEQE